MTRLVNLCSYALNYQNLNRVFSFHELQHAHFMLSDLQLIYPQQSKENRNTPGTEDARNQTSDMRLAP